LLLNQELEVQSHKLPEGYYALTNKTGLKEKLRQYVALTIPVFLFVILFTHFIISEDYRRSHVFEPPYLLPILNFIFLGLSSLLVSFLAAKSYLKTGQWKLALLGSGALAFGLTGITAGWFIQMPGGVNITVTIFNCGMLLAGLLHFFCSVAGILELVPARDPDRKKRILFSIYCTILILFFLIVKIILLGWMPLFFVQGIGPTMLRQFVLGTSILLLLISGIYLYSLYYRTRIYFLYWYALGLILIAEGLLGVMLSKNVGGIIGWTGRLAQYTGGIFLLVAVYDTLKERPLHDVLSDVFKKPQELYISLFENSLDGIIVAVHAGAVLKVNPSACTVLGYDHLKSGQLAIQDFFDTGHSLYQKFRDELSAKGKAIAELVLIDKKRDRIPVMVSAAVFEDIRGEKLEVLTFKDITSRKRNEDALRQAHGLIHGITQGTKDMIAAQDSQFRYIFFNDAYRREFKRLWNQDIEIGTSMVEAMETWPEEQRKAADLWSRALSGESFNTTMNFGPSEGKSQVYDLCFNPVHDEDNRHIGAAHIIRNITEQVRVEQALRESEALYRTIIENFPDGAIYVFDHDLRFRVADGQALKTLGYSRESLEGKTIWEINDEEISKILEQRYLKILAGESHHFETPLKGRIFSSSYVPIRDENKKVIAGMVVSQDITERRRIEKALQQLNETLENRVAERTSLAEARTKQLQSLMVELIETEERERRKFAHLLHDDLQQMLAAAKIQLQIISYQFPNEPVLSNVEQIIEKSIIKSRSLSHELSPPILDRAELITALQWLCRQMKEQFGLEVTFETNLEKQPEYVHMKTFIFRAVQEMLFNVVKHSGVNSACLFISENNSHVSIEVSDNGEGFDPVRLDPSRIGFGLMSIKERARYIGGSLTIESAPQKGSRFTLALPLMVLTDNLNHQYSAVVQKI
jgi:PAS domain S-box-containing protein